MNSTLDVILVNRCNQSDEFRTVLPAKLCVRVLMIVMLASAAVFGVGAGVGAAEGVNIALVGHFGGETQAVATSGNCAYIGQGQDLVVFDISDPTAPSKLSRLTAAEIVRDIMIAGDYAYIANGHEGLVDVSNKTAPLLVGHYNTTGAALGVAVSGDYVYVADWDDGLVIVDVSNKMVPMLVGSYGAAIGGCGVAVSGNYVYAVDWDDGLAIVDVSNPVSPSLAGSYDTAGSACSVAVSGVMHT